MFNRDPSLSQETTLSTETIQKYLEQNKDLIVAIMQCQNQGNFTDATQYLAKLQFNLTNLAKLADAVPQAPTHSQGQGMQHPPPPPNVALSQQQQQHHPRPFNMDERMQQLHQEQLYYERQQQQLQSQQQQHHPRPVNIDERMQQLHREQLHYERQQQLQSQQQQHHLPLSLPQPDIARFPFLMSEQQQMPGAMGNFAGNNNGMYQAAQARLSNMSDMHETSQSGQASANKRS